MWLVSERDNRKEIEKKEITKRKSGRSKKLLELNKKKKKEWKIYNQFKRKLGMQRGVKLENGR